MNMGNWFWRRSNLFYSTDFIWNISIHTIAHIHRERGSSMNIWIWNTRKHFEITYSNMKHLVYESEMYTQQRDRTNDNGNFLGGARKNFVVCVMLVPAQCSFTWKFHCFTLAAPTIQHKRQQKEDRENCSGRRQNYKNMEWICMSFVYLMIEIG